MSDNGGYVRFACMIMLIITIGRIVRDSPRPISEQTLTVAPSLRSSQLRQIHCPSSRRSGIARRSLAEEVRVRAGPGKDEFRLGRPVDQDPVGGEVAVAMGFPLAFERMGGEIIRQG